MNVILDILICTYNRPHLLKKCLVSLSNQHTDRRDWGIIIINNYHQPINTDIVASIPSSINVEIYEEPVPGLSKARNKGITVSKARWLGFLDDDARVPSTYISKVMNIIETRQFDCFGGHIRSWWPYGRPRWLDKDYGSKPILSANPGIIKEGYNWGSHLFIKKKALDIVGGFPEGTGLKGSKLGYGAENIVQDKLRNKGFIIGYDPDFVIDHAVLPQKLKLLWHLRAAYSTGRDGRTIFKDQYTLRGFIRTGYRCLTVPVKAFYKWLVEKDFFWENMLLSTLQPIALLAGKIRSLF